MIASYNSPSTLWRTIAATALALLLATSGGYAKKRSAKTFDHSKFDRLLSTAVANGRVDYAKFRGNADFTAYLTSLETAQITALPTDEKLAFWINAYNAMVIKNVLANPGMRRPTDVKGFFDQKKFKVAGRMLTLNEIENTVIRPTFKEPLIHFGLVCAARSCPPLLKKAYTGANVRSLLAQNASDYLASKYNSYDKAKNTLTLSQIFEWYKSDFNNEAGIREFVKRYGTQQMKKGLADSPNAKITYMEYDWTLNSK